MEPKYIVDTNVILRFLLADNKELYQRALAYFKKAETGKIKLIIPLIVLVQVIWVLYRSYSYDKSEIAKALIQLQNLKGVHILNREKFYQVLSIWLKIPGIDFIDAYILYMSRKNNTPLLTFDKKLNKHQQI